MILARVAGSVVTAARNDGIDGAVYLVTEQCYPDGTGEGSCLIALDIMGAAPGEFVLVSQGSSTRQTSVTKDKPVDALIIGIVEIVVEEGKVVFKK